MANVTIAGGVYDIRPIAPTRRNQGLLTDVYNDAKAFLETVQAGTTERRIATVVNRYPDLLRMMQIDGSFNPEFLQKHIDADKRNYEEVRAENPDMPDYDAAAGIERAGQEARKALERYIQQNPDIARDLYFGSLLWPSTMTGLNKGLEIICKTASRGGLPENVVAALDAGVDSPEFDDTQASEVAAYVEQFLASCG